MGVENRIKFEARYEDKVKELKSYMVFEVSPCDGEMYEEKVEIGCYEDIEMYFKLYFKQNWKEIFPNRDVWGAEFKGMRFIGNNKDVGATLNLDLEHRAEAWVHFDRKKMEDKNVQIIDEIRKIVSQ